MTPGPCPLPWCDGRPGRHRGAVVRVEVEATGTTQFTRAHVHHAATGAAPARSAAAGRRWCHVEDRCLRRGGRLRGGCRHRRRWRRRCIAGSGWLARSSGVDLMAAGHAEPCRRCELGRAARTHRPVLGDGVGCVGHDGARSSASSGRLWAAISDPAERRSGEDRRAVDARSPATARQRPRRPAGGPPDAWW